MAIRRRTYASGQEAWQLDLTLSDGRRYQRSFATKREAETEEARVQGERRRYGDVALAMTQADRLRYAAAEVKLGDAGVTLEQAVEWALAQAPARKKAMALQPLFRLFIEHKERMKKRPRYVRQLRVCIGSFVRGREEQTALAVTKDEVKDWLFGNGWAPKTQGNYLTDLRTFFNWARREGYVTHRPCDGIEIPDDEEKEIPAFGPEQCEKLLVTALSHVGRIFDKTTQRYHDGPMFRSLLGYATLALFEGVRPEELQKLSRAVIDLDHRTMIVEGAKAKTRQRRVIELCDAAVAWLRKWMEFCPAQETIIPKNFRRLWELLREKAGLARPGWHSRRVAAVRAASDNAGSSGQATPWPSDVLRHTAATMHYAEHRDLKALEALLGHEKDQATLFRHYRAVRLMDGRTVTKALATRFYAIRP